MQARILAEIAEIAEIAVALPEILPSPRFAALQLWRSFFAFSQLWHPFFCRS